MFSMKMHQQRTDPSLSGPSDGHASRQAVTGRLYMIKPDLSLSFRPVRAASKGRWVKAGVEFYEGKLNISIIAADLWADWNLLPLSETAIKQNEVSIEFEREQKEDGSYGMVLKAYVNRYNGGEKTMIREVTWVFHEQDEEDEMWIGVYAARPIQDEREALVVTMKNIEIERRQILEVMPEESLPLPTP